MTYLDELGRELHAVGIRGARRRRILAEVDDHLHETDDVSTFGEPRLVAQRFADELATVQVRRSAFAVFAALAPAGFVFAGLFATLGRGGDIASARTLPVGITAAAAMLLAPQVALASGLLAIVRAWRLRGLDAAPAAELAIVRRRAAVALASGAVTLGAVGLYACEYSARLTHTWLLAAAVGLPAAALPLVVVVPGVATAAMLRPGVPGDAGDLTTDLGPRATPDRTCLVLVLAAAAAALAGAGLDEGLRNAVGETIAIVGSYALLGRFLGLRR